MTGMTPRRAFTLVELMVVTVILTIATGLVTVQVHGLTGPARLQAAAIQIGALFRLALLEASRSGLPRVLRLDHREGAVLKPVYVEGQWTWSDGVSILFVSKVKVVGVAPTVTTEHERSAQAPWRIVLAPGGMNPGYRIDLRHRNGLSGIVRIDGRTGVEELRLAPDE